MNILLVEIILKFLFLYFFNRRIVNYIYDNLLDLDEIKDGNIPTMIVGMQYWWFWRICWIHNVFKT